MTARNRKPPAGRSPVQRVITGKHPSTGVIHKLTLYEDGTLLIERKPYVSDNADGWTQTYQPLTERVELHQFLIRTIENNPCEWE